MTKGLTFEQVCADEHALIRTRRQFIKDRLKPGRKSKPAEGAPDGPPRDLVGLALSGGGIRSATFCLGVVQALDSIKIGDKPVSVIDKIDYISAVSGGGYLASSLVNAMVIGGGDNPFTGGGSTTAAGKPTRSDDINDTDAVGHLRDHSNYLIPNGGSDVLTAAAIIARGLAANAALVLWVPLLLALITVGFNPTYESLSRPVWLERYLGLSSPFALTSLTAIFVAGSFLLWAIGRSRSDTVAQSDVGGIWPKIGAGLLIALGAVAASEAQPLIIKSLFDSASTPAGPPASSGTGLLTWLSALLAPVTAMATFFRSTLKAYLADTSYNSTRSALVGRATAKIILWIGALALPALIWLLYIHLSYWAIRFGQGPGMTGFAHSPGWLAAILTRMPSSNLTWLPYAGFSLLFVVASYPLAANANSLHHLYRDRLARAFHFDPTNGCQPAVFPHGQGSRDMPRLSDMANAKAPYLLINTAVNLQSSATNRRGRNADFFVLSPLAVGSETTGYVPTSAYTDAGMPLELATAMAISGAAASSNMGAQTIRPLSPTLAMLNVRLGYWLRNPNTLVAPARVSLARETLTSFSHYFLFSEMFGQMTEKDPRVYLSDGGHIENLGLYELLRRKCSTIVVVDAEADPQMRFGSFITLQIYARIDLGVRISLPVEGIRDATVKAMKGEAAIAAETTQAAKPPPQPLNETLTPSGPRPTGPHVAIGRIDYGEGIEGTLIYIKASLSGDENDYVRDYVRRNPTFPHETTGDQFFSEEQFEVYRALGFHIAHRFFEAKDEAIVAQDEGCVSSTLAGSAASDPRTKALLDRANALVDRPSAARVV